MKSKSSTPDRKAYSENTDMRIIQLMMLGIIVSSILIGALMFIISYDKNTYGIDCTGDGDIDFKSHPMGEMTDDRAQAHCIWAEQRFSDFDTANADEIDYEIIDDSEQSLETETVRVGDYNE